MEVESYKLRKAYGEILSAQDKRLHEAMHKAFPPSKYPFAMKPMVDAMAKCTMDLNGVCRTREEFVALYEEVSEFILTISLELIGMYEKAMDKAIGGA